MYTEYWMKTVLTHILHNSKSLGTQAAFYFGEHVFGSDRCSKCHYWEKKKQNKNKTTIHVKLLIFLKRRVKLLLTSDKIKMFSAEMEKQHSSQNRRNSLCWVSECLKLSKTLTAC